METPAHISRQRLDYQVVLELRILHTYYHQLRCRDLEITPTAETMERLKGFGLLFRNEGDGFMVAADRNRDYRHPIFQQPVDFDFQWSVNNPNFLNFTDLPYIAGQFHLFESADEEGTALHAGHFAGPETLQPFETDGIGGLIRLRHDPQRPMVPMYTEWTNAQLRIHYVRFRARDTFFSYFIYGREMDEETIKLFFVENFEINKKSYTFTTPQFATLRNGTKGFRIRSLEPLSMRESYTGQGTLVMRKRSVSPFEYRKSLPMPKPDMVVFDPVSKTYVSELFVKL